MLSGSECICPTSTCTPSSCNPSCCFDVEPGCKPPTRKCCQTPEVSRLARFVTGQGSLSPKHEIEQHCKETPSPSQHQSNHNKCCRPRPYPPPPPVCILTCPVPCPPPPCNPFQNSPASRLRHVDVQEELCYCPPPDPKCPPGCFEYYNMCNGCGGLDYVPGVCMPNCCDPPPEPVMYSRRQRFSFNDASGHGKQCNAECGSEPPWPFPEHGCQTSHATQHHRKACHVNSFDELPVGKNPVAKPIPCCCACCRAARAEKCCHHEPKKEHKKKLTTQEICEQGLPKCSGVYYFNKCEGRFEKRKNEPIRVVCPPQAPQPCPEPQIVVTQRQPEVIVQPIYQQPCCQPQCCPQPCCWNPSMGMGGVFGGANCMNGNVVPMCIPMCGPMMGAANGNGGSTSKSQQKQRVSNASSFCSGSSSCSDSRKDRRRSSGSSKHKKKKGSTGSAGETASFYTDNVVLPVVPLQRKSAPREDDVTVTQNTSVALEGLEDYATTVDTNQSTNVDGYPQENRKSEGDRSVGSI